MNRFKSLFISGCVLASGFAFAANEGPNGMPPPPPLPHFLTLRAGGGGPLRPGVHGQFLACDIYSVRVHVANELDPMGKDYPVIFSNKVNSAPQVRAMIAAAAKGHVTERMGPADVPTSTYEAYAEGSTQAFKLGQQGSWFATNDAPEAATLMEFIDENCRSRH